jgi:hypothetical protein
MSRIRNLILIVLLFASWCAAQGDYWHWYSTEHHVGNSDVAYTSTNNAHTVWAHGLTVYVTYTAVTDGRPAVWFWWKKWGQLPISSVVLGGELAE